MRLALLLLLSLAALSRAQDVDLSRLPPLWRVTQRVDVVAQRDMIGRRLGATITKLENVTYDAAGVGLKVNVIVCGTEAEAEAAVEALARGGKPPGTIGRRGRTVVELVGGQRHLWLAARAALGLDAPDEVRWSVSMTVSPLAEVDPDPTAYQRLFTLLGGVRRGEPVADEAARVAAGFRCGEGLAAPGFTATAVDPALGLVRYALEGVVAVRPFSGRPEAPPHRDLTRATPRWPVDADVVTRVASELEAGAPAARARVERALGWVRAHVRYDGDMGTRWGTLRVIEQGYGRCWDHADALVTLCRALGVPARQVHGWLAGLGGHVWCEVHLGDAWWPVDATASWIGTSADHVPFFTSEDGEVAAICWGPPDRLERASQSRSPR